MVVAPVSIRKGGKPEAALLVDDREVCGPDQVAKQVLGRLHVSFRGRGHGSCKLVDRVEDAVAGGLCEVHHRPSDRLVGPLLLLVQKLLPQLLQGQFPPYYGGLRGIAAFHTVALYHVLRVVFRANGDGSFLTVAGDVRTENFRHVAHVGHLEPAH